jgi:lysozyme
VIDVPQSAIELAKRFAGFEKRVKRGTEIAAVPYVCPAGFWTIGYGHLCAQDHQPITQDEAEGRLAAIVDFNFNLGAGRLQTSTLRRRLNQRGWIAASQELRRWVYGGGKVLPELALRREAEANFMSNDLK